MDAVGTCARRTALGRIARPLGRLAVRLVLVLVGGLLFPELLLRFLLFSDSRMIGHRARELRRASLYALPNSRDSWWLEARFMRKPGLVHPDYDATLGWTGKRFDPASYRHVDEANLRGRRPILLYGDSFAQCVTGPEECWQGLLEESQLTERHALLNYGVGGYGLDQALLLLERSVDLYAAQDPVVVMGVLVDDDLDRCALPLREFPKPVFELQGEGLVLHSPPGVGAKGYLELHPLGVRSYLWRLLLFGTDLFSSEQRARWTLQPEERELLGPLCARLVARVHQVCAERELTHFFLLFHGRGSVKSRGPYTWRETLLYETFEKLEMPFVSSKRFLWEAARSDGRSLDSYYVPTSAQKGRNHFTAEANRVVFAALRAGLDGRFESHEYLAGARPPGSPASGSRAR